MSIRAHGNGLAGVGFALLLGGAALACGGTRASSPPPATAGAKPAPRAMQQPSHAGRAPGAAESQPRPGQLGEGPNAGGGGDEADAELVVSKEVVARCPTLRLVRQHVSEIDPDMLWLAVLESIADCMSEDGPMSSQSLGVSGDEEHRHVIREVLGTRGVAPTRVVAEPPSSEGAAECQGGSDCLKRVEITIIVP